jgi:predicted nucleic acid-binding protein
MVAAPTPYKIFLDTNVLIDVLVQRGEFFDDAADIWSLSEQGRMTGIIAAVSMTNIYYIVRKLSDHKTAMKAMVQLRDVFAIAASDGQILSQAIDAKIADFEDAVQYFTAVHAGVAAIVTRDPRHFPRGAIPVVTPREFLVTWGAGPDPAVRTKADKSAKNPSSGA